MKKMLFLLSFLLIVNCSILSRTSRSKSNVKEYNEKSTKTVQKQAASDLKCDENNIKITVLKKSGTMYKELRAAGCDKKLDYINNFGWRLKTKSE